MTWIGISVSFLKSAADTDIGVLVPLGVVIGAGTSPSGNTNCTGSYDTMALIFAVLILVSQPGPPLAECVISTDGPILSNSAASASVTTLLSPGPVLGVCCRKY